MTSLLRKAVLALAVAGVGFTLPSIATAAEPAPAAQAKEAQAKVPVKVVVLFSSGVGYFEHIGPVKNDATAELQFKTNQINDILKSLVLQDTGGGRVSTIVYPSQEPIARTLKSFQVDITANPSLAELLNQLRGAKVSLTAGTENHLGTILGVEKKPKAVEKGHIEVWVLNLLTGGTIRQIQLEDVTKLDLQDKELQEELNKALTALAQARDQDKKPVTINFQGEGERLVRLGYVVETPIWKTSYRLLLPTKAEQKAGLQGWAIVENQTDNDWSNVQLSLVSGRPISFIQELYQPLYIPRPVVQPELYASLKPQTYDAGMELRRQVAGEELAEGQRGGMGGFGGGGYGAGMPANRAKAAAPPPTAARASGGRLAGDKADGAMLDALSRSIDPTASIASVASASKAGELFQYTVGNIDLPRQRSAMIPIITDPVEVEKLSIYPLNGARLKNTTKNHLLQGPITVLDGSSYAGDARIDNLPPGQERLLSYGVDLQMLVHSQDQKQEASITSGKIVKGVLHLQRKHVFTQTYQAQNKDEKDKTLIVEHPFRHGWTLNQPDKPLEKTEQLYRFKTTVPAGKQAGLTVQEQMVAWEEQAILPMDATALVWFVRNDQISKPVRDALAKAAGLKQAMTDHQRQVQQRQAEINRITAEQARIRENIKAAPDKSTLKTRLLEKLEEQEKQIEAIYASMDQSQKSFEKARKDLEDYLNSLDVGQ